MGAQPDEEGRFATMGVRRRENASAVMEDGGVETSWVSVNCAIVFGLIMSSAQREPRPRNSPPIHDLYHAGQKSSSSALGVRDSALGTAAPAGLNVRPASVPPFFGTRRSGLGTRDGNAGGVERRARLQCHPSSALGVRDSALGTATPAGLKVRPASVPPFFGTRRSGLGTRDGNASGVERQAGFLATQKRRRKGKKRRPSA